MRRYNARDILELSLKEVWRFNNEGWMEVEFDDGEVIRTQGRRTIFSRYTWEIHHLYPETPLLKRHHIGDQLVGTRTHLDLISHGLWDCRDAYLELNVEVDLEYLSRLAYEITNQIYNDFQLETEEYVTSISALDFVRVLKNQRVAAINHEIMTKPHVREGDVTRAQDELKKILLDPNEITDNAVANAARSGMVTMGQIIQCIGPRGMATDIDSHIFKNAIRTGFAKGLYTLEDMLKESRSASKSLYFQKDPMRRSEYFNRNIQLSTATLKNLHPGDCGSRDYLHVTINNKKLLRDMAGIHYYDVEAGKELTIWKDSTHLIGKTLPIRSVLTCQHHDRYGVCTRCFGELGHSIPKWTNLGHVSASVLQSLVTQLLLSNKHLDSSAVADAIRLSEFDQNFIALGGNENNIYISKGLKGKKFKICINEAEAPNLVDVKTVNSADELIPYRLSELNYAYFIIDGEDNSTVTYPVTVSSGTRLASLSRHMLRYIKKHGWIINEDHQYEIDMSHWNFDHALVELPQKHFSTVDYMFSIESFIKGGAGRGKKSIMSYSTASAALMAFHDLVSLKLDCHLSYLQVIILATMAQDREGRNYNLPMPRKDGQTTRYRQQMRLRSLSAAMAYQGQADIIYSAESYLIKNRPEHYLDWLLV